MYQKVFSIFMLMMIVIFVGCSDEFEKQNVNSEQNSGNAGLKSGIAEQTTRSIDNELFPETEYNNDFRLIAKTVMNVLKSSPATREMIKTEAAKQFDGDFDVLFEHINDQSLMINNSSQTFFETMSNNVPDNELQARNKTGSEILEEIFTKYPTLQISVPVHNAKWETEKYVPLVTFIPEDYDEATHKEVTAYTPSGNLVGISTIERPQKPVVVVGLCERIMPPGGPDPEDPIGGPLDVPSPENLSATQVNSGVHLAWEMPSDIDLTEIGGYKVYRKRNDENSYQYIGLSSHYTNQSYNDNSVVSGYSYSYFVTANDLHFNNESLSSNYVNIIVEAIEPPENFEVIMHTNEVAELRWDNGDAVFSETAIWRKVVQDYNYYTFIDELDGSISHYHDDINDYKGKKIIYKIRHQGGNMVSDERYDFIRVPHRNPSQPEPVILGKISFTDWDIEHWIAGKPEFKLTVANMNRETKTPYKIHVNLDYKFSGRRKWETFTSYILGGWYQEYWYDVLSFNLVEYDRGGTMEVEATASYTKKKEEEGDEEDDSNQELYELEFDYNYEVPNNSENCGSSYLYFYDEIDKTITFPEFGAKIDFQHEENSGR